MDVVDEGGELFFFPIHEFAHIGDGAEVRIELSEVVAVDDGRPAFREQTVMLHVQIASDSLRSHTDKACGRFHHAIGKRKRPHGPFGEKRGARAGCCCVCFNLRIEFGGMCAHILFRGRLGGTASFRGGFRRAANDA